jgi:hypothetical protein
MSDSTERDAAIDRIAHLPAQIRTLTAPLTPTELTARPLQNEWSVAQNVHHLFDSHANSYIRCKLIMTEENPPLRAYEQDRWAELPDASSADISASLDLLQALHVRWVQFWRALGPSDWLRGGMHSQYGAMTLDRIVRSYAQHGEDHIEQITRTVAALPR